MAISFAWAARQGFGNSARLLVTSLLVALIAGCAPIYRNHGYIPSEEELALITVGEDSRESVGTIIGRPSAEGLLNDEGWYYVQSKFKSVGMFAPKEEVRQVVAISFDTDGVVENVERFGLEKGRIVPLSRRVTSNNVKGKGILAQIFGNIGGIAAGEQLMRK